MIRIGGPRHRYDIFDFVSDLINGDAMALYAIALIAGFITFCMAYKKFTGKSFVKSKKERREARHRRKFVLWEYKR